ncbi:MAG: ferritin-like domain-containing protein [Actinomycetota bacterium]|nr:ferritin-like domain-containing protein [Actinomycetota bacterium]
MSGARPAAAAASPSGAASVRPSRKRPTRAAVAALQRALAGEHAAIYGYGALGARLERPSRTVARAALDAHRTRRDGLERLIAGAGETPEAAAAAYDLPDSLVDAPSAAVLAVRLEEVLSELYLAVLRTEPDQQTRSFVAGGLQEQAVRAVGWRRLAGSTTSTAAFPGLPGPASA